MTVLSAQRTRSIVSDIVSARYDMVELARRHRLSQQGLSDWVMRPRVLRELNGLCVLADVQTQLLLSRYRTMAATRLIKLATEEGTGDVARRACVDLLRVDLKRADLDPRDAATPEDPLANLPGRAMLYPDDAESS